MISPFSYLQPGSATTQNCGRASDAKDLKEEMSSLEIHPLLTFMREQLFKTDKFTFPLLT